MISLDSVTVTFDQAVPLNDLTCEIRPGTSAVMGPSGSGKSTLLRVLAGLQPPDSGHVWIDGAPVQRPTWRSAGDLRVALIHQNYRLVDFLSVGDNLRLAAELRGVEVTSRQGECAMGAVGLSASMLGRLPASLSGGEQQRVAIARALMGQVQVLLADEPTGALDAANTARVAEVLRAVGNRGGVAVVVATHDPHVAEIASDVFDLADGKLKRR